MRTLLVDARWFNGSGIGRYLGEVLRHVLVDGRFDRLRMLGDPEAIARFARAHDATQRVQAVPYPIGGYSPRAQLAWLARGRYGAGECAASFFPHYDAPLAGLPSRSVVAVHDLTHFEVPDAFPAWRRAAAGVLLQRVVKAAGHVVVLSRSTHRDLVGRIPEAETKTSLVPLGLSNFFSRVAAEGPPRSGFADRLRPYLLCVGNRKPHKNLIAAVEVLARARRRYPSLRLVFVGAEFDGWDPVRRRAESLGIADAVEDLRCVDDARLAELYAGAELLLFPSRYEGLGLPVLEAMACGTPVVASNRSSVPELAGDAAVLVDPHDHDGMAEAVCGIMASAAVRADLIARGRSRFGQFDWEASGRRLVDILDTVARQGSVEPRLDLPGEPADGLTGERG